MIGFIKEEINKTIRSFYLERIYSRRKMQAKSIIKEHVLEKLTDKEITQIKEIWGQLTNNIYLPPFQLYKRDNIFDARFLPHEIYSPLIERALNPYKNMFYASNKSMAPILYPELNHPQTIIRKVNGCFFDSTNKCINQSLALEILINCDEEHLIFKDGADTYGGFGVHKVALYNLDRNGRITLFRDLMNRTKGDFIVQCVIKQHSQTAIFNSNSLNCFRVTTLFINDKVTVCGSQFKTGLGGACVDNIAIGGGVIFKVDADGTLSDFAYDKYFNKIYQSPEGIRFQNRKIDDFPKVISTVTKYHPIYFPCFGIVGWDVAIDENSVPVFIEANLWYPGIWMEQQCSGAIFGDRTQEVIDYVKNKKYDINYYGY